MTQELKGKETTDYSLYPIYKAAFFRNSGMISLRLEEKKETVCFKERLSNQDEAQPDGNLFAFVTNPVNPEASKLLEQPDNLTKYFKEEGFEVHRPMPVVSKSGSTLFISAGVQNLESVYIGEGPISNRSIYVAQPVFRTQYVGQAAEGISTSFVNVCLESINQGAETHFQNLQKVFTLFANLGLKREDFLFEVDEKESSWGDRTHLQKRVKIFFQGLEIGDAIFIEGFPQNTRKSLEISDIGLGFERLKWVLKGGSYWDVHEEASSHKHRLSTVDSTKTLALLAGSDVVPHYKAHGYRFRLLSKKVVEELASGESREGLSDLLGKYHDYWNKWTELPVSKGVSLKRVLDENTRNFNVELINRLKNFYDSVDVDINRPTDQVVQLLKGTPADISKIQDIINEMGGVLL